MGKTKYWRLKLKGELSNDEVEGALRDRAVTILRVDKEKGETRVYFSSVEEADRIPKAQAQQKRDEAEEVSLDEVTKVG